MRGSILLSFLCATAISGCNRPPTSATNPDFGTDPGPPPDSREDAPREADSTEPAPSGSRRERIVTPPVAGLEYWADTPMTTESFLERAKAAGITIEHTVTVGSVPELLEALAPNTAIVLAPGRHVFEDSAQLATPEDKAKLPDWSSLSPYYDNHEIHDLHDLVIVGPGPDPTVVLQNDGYAHALNLLRVENVALHNLTIGHHPEQGWCKGGVVKIVESKNILITDSTLFGSGTQGLSLVTVDGLRLEDSVITNSSEQFSTFSHSRDVIFDRVRVVGNRADLLRGFAIYRSTVQINNSVIADNKELRWENADSYDVLFAIDDFDMGTWYVDEPKALDGGPTQSRVKLRNTQLDGERIDREL